MLASIESNLLSIDEVSVSIVPNLLSKDEVVDSKFVNLTPAFKDEV